MGFAVNLPAVIGTGMRGGYVIAVAVGIVSALVVLRAELRRRRIGTDAVALALWIAAAGILGARVYYLLQSPRALVSAPGLLLRASGFSWYGALIGGFIAALLLARALNIRALVLLDIVSPAAAWGFGWAQLVAAAFGGLGSAELTWVERAFPDVIAFVVFAAIGYWLWVEGRRASQLQRPEGNVFGEYLILTGGARFLLEFLRADRRPALGPLSHAQVASLVSIAAGGVLIAVVVRHYMQGREEHRILEHVASYGDALQPEYTPPSEECPHPERWKMLDTMTAEDEVLTFLKSLITTVKPNLVVETGTFRGISTLAIAEGLRQNGFGRVVTIEYDPKVFAAAKERIESSGLTRWVEYRNESSLDTKVEGTIDILFCDSAQTIREQEVRRFLPQVSCHGLILVHDASSHYKVVREAVLRLEQEGLISVVLLPTPRGLAVAQKRDGRR